MFDGHGVLNFDGDHIDISYRNPDPWPSFTAGGSIKSFAFDIGDSNVGPVVQLGLMKHVDGEVLDWAHSIDPPHFHGSDQFRVISSGKWDLAGQELPAGSFSFQEAGRMYREHPGEDGAAWMMLIVGDRRGIRPTILRDADRQNLIQTGSVYDTPLDDGETYPHPAGPKGVTAIATTAGSCERGYLRGTFNGIAANSASGQPAAITGVLGEETAGPVVHLLKHGPNEIVAPASTYATERLLVITEGSCRVGDREYSAGDLRIQRADSPMAAVVSGPEGVSATFVVADRRARPSVEDSPDDAPKWMFDVNRVLEKLTPAPGGPRA